MRSNDDSTLALLATALEGTVKSSREAKAELLMGTGGEGYVGIYRNKARSFSPGRCVYYSEGTVRKAN